MSLVDRDSASADALLTDLYLDALLAGAVLDAAAHGAEPAAIDRDLDPAARKAADRLRRDLVRVHPSFRFEERLALRLAEVAASMRLPVAAGGEGQVVPIRPVQPASPDPLRVAAESEDDRDPRPLIIGGAVAASAFGLAGAWLAWRRRTSPMARAVRAAHQLRLPGGGA